MKRAALLLMIVLSAPALAQQPSAIEQALGQRAMAEFNANVQASAVIIDMRRQLAEAQARVKALEDKYEPKTVEKPAGADSK